jgi:spermidine synthase
MTTDRSNQVRNILLLALVLVSLAFVLWYGFNSSHQIGWGGSGDEDEDLGRLELDTRSDYSRIRIRRLNNTRTLLFVRDTGEEVVESKVNLDRPHDLLVTYTQYMFLSYLFQPKHEKVLLVGLGGGAMVHFLKHYDPKVKVDVVEIDPAIGRIADKYFEVRSEGNVNIMIKDGFEHLRKAEEKYDIIYMDAFLKPSRDTDSTGVPLRLKTIKFYKEIQERLTPGGMVVFNINGHDELDDDLKNIGEAFPQAYVFHLPGRTGVIAVGSMAERRVAKAELLDRASKLDRRFATRFSFRDMTGRMDE